MNTMILESKYVLRLIFPTYLNRINYMFEEIEEDHIDS
jgi:hypothetical protein